MYKVKLADKMRALEKLELYFDLLPDNHKRKMEEEKMKLAAAQFEWKIKQSEPPDPEEYEDDGFLEALEGKVDEVWADEENEEA